MTAHRLASLILVSVCSVASTGCATLTTSIDPEARKAGVTGGSQVKLYGNAEGLQVYQQGSTTPLKIVMVQDLDFKTALKNSARESAARQAAEAQGAVSYSYTQAMYYSPAVFLDQRRAHTLRLMRADGAEATVEVKPHIGKGYFIMDWLLFAPSLGATLLVDWSTGKWKVFDGIDVSAAFPGTPEQQEIDRMSRFQRAVTSSQERVLSRDRRYTRSVKKLGLNKVKPPHKVKVPTATEAGYAVILSRSNRKGKSCVFYHGQVDPIPATAAERKHPAAPDQLVCDG